MWKTKFYYSEIGTLNYSEIRTLNNLMIVRYVSIISNVESYISIDIDLVDTVKAKEKLADKKMITIVEGEMHMNEKIVSEEHKLFWNNWKKKKCIVNSEGLMIGDDYLMFFAERELMRKHAEMLIGDNKQKDLLEIGYGLGVFSEEAYAVGVKSYTVIEIHPELVKRAENWKKGLVNPDKVKIISNAWQLSLNLLKKYDAIMYDSCPPPGWDNVDFKHLIEILCKKHLKEGGLFSHFNIGLSVDPERERVLNKYFVKYSDLNYEMKTLPRNWSLSTDQFLISVYKKLPAMQS